MRVDSFLVCDGRAIRPDLHRARFGAGYPSLDAVPRTGEWFPRITDAGVDVRPAPPLRRTTTLWIPGIEDPRTTPRVKGPDLPMLVELRAQAHVHGADDALLHANGYALEAANAALLVFDGRDWFQAPESQILASTTVTAVVEAGLLPAPRRRAIPLAELKKSPALVASALHGFTPVVAWVHDGQTIPAPAVELDAAALNAALWQYAERL